MPRKADRIDTTRAALDVYLHGQLVGSLGEHEADVWFRYQPVDDAANALASRALSVRMPLRALTYGHRDTLVFFDNLLLESDTRDELARFEQRDSSDVAGLLGRVGAECSGAVSIWPTGTAVPAVSAYREYSPLDLEALFDERHGERLTQAQLESRQVMSGVQRKLVFRRYKDGWHLPLQGAPGTHILKRASGRYDGLVANELACLKCYAALDLHVPEARAIGHSVADADGLPEPRLIVIQRFDRVESTDKLDGAMPNVQRLHQEDMCQVTGRLPKRKYQRDGGPGLRDLAVAIRRFSSRPAHDLQQLLSATIANVCLGNADAHAKNFALLYTDTGPQLAPFYDVVSTEVYPALSPHLSMRVGHAYDPSALRRDDVIRLAADLSVAPALVRSTVEHVTMTLRAVRDDVLNQVAKEIGGTVDVLNRMQVLLESRVPVIEQMARSL